MRNIKMKAGLFATIMVVMCAQSGALAQKQLEWKDDIAAGEVAYKAGENQIAEKCFLSALEKAEKFGPNDPRLGATLNDLGIIYDESQRYEKAETVYKRALAIREKALGANSSDVATTLNNLANLYKDESKYALAEPIYTRVLDIYSKTTGTDSQFMAMAYSNLGALYRVEGKTKESISSYKKALEVGDKSLGPENAHVIGIVSRLAEQCAKDGNDADAKIYYKRYLDSTSEAAGLRKNTKTIDDMKQLVKTLRHDGQTEHAEMVEKAIKYQEEKGQ
jgi:tetratricopeptide (TPR) repeat protein